MEKEYRSLVELLEMMELAKKQFPERMVLLDKMAQQQKKRLGELQEEETDIWNVLYEFKWCSTTGAIAEAFATAGFSALKLGKAATLIITVGGYMASGASVYLALDSALTGEVRKLPPRVQVALLFGVAPWDKVKHLIFQNKVRFQQKVADNIIKYVTNKAGSPSAVQWYGCPGDYRVWQEYGGKAADNAIEQALCLYHYELHKTVLATESALGLQILKVKRTLKSYQKALSEPRVHPRPTPHRRQR